MQATPMRPPLVQPRHRPPSPKIGAAPFALNVKRARSRRRQAQAPAQPHPLPLCSRTAAAQPPAPPLRRPTIHTGSGALPALNAAAELPSAPLLAASSCCLRLLLRLAATRPSGTTAPGIPCSPRCTASPRNNQSDQQRYATAPLRPSARPLATALPRSPAAAPALHPALHCHAARAACRCPHSPARRPPQPHGSQRGGQVRRRLLVMRRLARAASPQQPRQRRAHARSRGGAARARRGSRV